jgi:hypothetical protein
MSIEQELRDAMRAHTEQVDPTGSYDDVRERAEQATSAARRRRATGGALLAAAAVAGAVFAASALRGDDGVEVDIVGPGPSTTASTTTIPTSTTANSSTTVVPPPTAATPTSVAAPPPPPPPVTQPDPVFIWTTGAEDSAAAARAFAIEYLGMTDPFVEEGEEPLPQPISVRATERGPETLIWTEQPTPGRFVITSVASPNLHFTSPGAGGSISSPLTVAGLGRAFEGTVQIEVRQDGQLFGQNLGATFATGSAGPDLGPFEATLTIDPPTTQHGSIVLWVASAEDGTTLEATVIPIRFAGF